VKNSPETMKYSEEQHRRERDRKQTKKSPLDEIKQMF
jgi:hypothetical protein